MCMATPNSVQIRGDCLLQLSNILGQAVDSGIQTFFSLIVRGIEGGLMVQNCKYSQCKMLQR
jgi:hypothetical protein